MTSAEAKKTLGLYRPGSSDASDPEVAQALEQTQRDPELRQWFEQSCAFHSAMREKLRQISVPDDLKENILSKERSVRPVQVAFWLKVAAVLVLLLGLAAFWFQPRPRDRFGDYRLRMVRAALKQYRMEIVTNDLNAVRQFLRERGAPADYVVPDGLEKQTLAGGGRLEWRGNPVSMVCFQGADKRMLFMFVVGRSVLKDAPAAVGELARVNKLLTESWSQGDKTYILAGPEDSALLRRR